MTTPSASLTDCMASEGKDVTNPGLDVNDFIGMSFATSPRATCISCRTSSSRTSIGSATTGSRIPITRRKFKAKYGYDLGVPVNWSAYEDIADFFTNDIKEINGTRIYGHMDYGKKDPSLGWRFTDAWLSMAGNGDKGIPNGSPVDEWGIRMEAAFRVGSSVERGGDVNGPAAVYALVKFLDWLKKYAPPQAQAWPSSKLDAVPGQGISPSRSSGTAPSPRHLKPESAGDECGWHAEVAHGTVAARRLLEGRHEAGLPGRRLLDAFEVCQAGDGARQPGFITVLRVEDGVAEEVDLVLIVIRETDIWDGSRSPSLRRNSAA